MALQSKDEFLVHRQGSVGNLSPNGYFKLSYEKLKEEIQVPLAIQETDIAIGTPGLMYPGPSLRYSASGQLDVDFPTSLRFIDILTEDDPQPLTYIDHQSGDFYLVSIPENETITISSAFWPGIDGTEDLSVNSQPKAQGTVYRATTGLYEGFGGIANVEVDLINHTSDIATGLVINVNIYQGSMRWETISIVNGGVNFVDNDVIEYKSTLSGAAGAFFKVLTDGNGAVVDLTPVVSPDPDDLDGDYYSETAGFGFQMPLEISGRIDNANTRAKSGIGQDLKVNLEVKDGKIKSVSLSPYSQHNNYRNGDTLVVNNGIGVEGDGLIEVIVLTDNVGYVFANNGDKVIYKGATTLEPARWLLVPVSGDSKAIVGISAEDLPRVTDDVTGEYIFYNPGKALKLGNDAANKVATIAIRVAHYEYNTIGNTAELNAVNSYAGFILPAEKEKLSTVAFGATPGSVNSVEADPAVDLYNGQKYSVIEVTNLSTSAGDEVFLNIRKTEIGKFGTVMMTSNDDWKSLIVSKAYIATQTNVPLGALPSADDLAEYLMPRNISSLRKLY